VHVGGMEVGSGAVGGDLLRDGRTACRPDGQKQKRAEPGPQGSTVTVVFDTWVRGIVIA
jgi:hypothetical protein